MPHLNASLKLLSANATVFVLVQSGEHVHQTQVVLFDKPHEDLHRVTNVAGFRQNLKNHVLTSQNTTVHNHEVWLHFLHLQKQIQEFGGYAKILNIYL